MSDIDGKQFEACTKYFMRLFKQLDVADQMVEMAQYLSQCREGGVDEMLEQYKKCSEENKKRFEEGMKCFLDYAEGLNDQKALAGQIAKRAEAGEFTN